MTPLRTFRKTVFVLAATLGWAALACALPENTYQRWQLLDGTIHANARWIYERCRFDATPIDVAFIGPSRIGAGVDAPRLGEDLRILGAPSRVVNFSLPETGRNINYTIADLLFAYKQPKLVVIGVTEKPSRFGHTAFKYVAARSQILEPGYLGDLNYFSDLAYLPFRQLRLFGADVLPDGLGLSKRFDATRYRGSSIDTTGSIVLPDGSIKQGDAPASAAELARGVKKLEAGNHPPFLGSSFADLEFGDERHYISKIAGLAHAHGAQVLFLFLPYYTGPDVLQEQPFYERFGDVLNAGFLATHAEYYADYGHLTRGGAEVATNWVAQPIATLLLSKDSKQ